MNIADQLDLARHPVIVVEATALGIEKGVRPGQIIMCDPRYVTVGFGPEQPAWERVRLLLEEEAEVEVEVWRSIYGPDGG